MLNFIRKLFLDSDQLELIEKLDKTPGRVRVVGRGTVVANQDMLVKSPQYKQAIENAAKLVASR
ncbi:MAG: hypothetical protein JJ871_08500 [Thalassospira sp.]|uniref:hypothetical protein n=1 Tax=Thalassospira sp. TaxID=1912094 RepID=UPI001B12ADCC|nr:hypothetical protein [Thalassospira sp.]MBO6579924.1 hypothetical protein [Thalassospira sp.]MBO6804643.1 hypothetical protein [Thalassospira sp.]MBO6819676.1 hypothetical protein [Thalassospira sp.]MBO6888092.1 hypothetical protein [Thalassospira sp.]